MTSTRSAAATGLPIRISAADPIPGLASRHSQIRDYLGFADAAEQGQRGRHNGACVCNQHSPIGETCAVDLASRARRHRGEEQSRHDVDSVHAAAADPMASLARHRQRGDHVWGLDSGSDRHGDVKADAAEQARAMNAVLADLNAILAGTESFQQLETLGGGESVQNLHTLGGANV